MFWERFYDLCIKNGTKPNPLGRKIGISSGVITKWKNGTIPNSETLIRIAEMFHCSVDYLLGISDVLFPAQHETSEKEKRVISAYRDNPDIQPAVDRLLKIEEPVLCMVSQESPAQEETKLAAFHGTQTTTTADPHEIANILTEIDDE